MELALHPRYGGGALFVTHLTSPYPRVLHDFMEQLPVGAFWWVRLTADEQAQWSRANETYTWARRAAAAAHKRREALSKRGAMRARRDIGRCAGTALSDQEVAALDNDQGGELDESWLAVKPGVAAF